MMKSFRQFLLEISTGQREQHSTGEYEWKGAQWIKQNKKGLKPAAKKDIGAELTKQAESRNKVQQSKQQQQYKHSINIQYSKPGSTDMYGGKVDVVGSYGGSDEGQQKALEAAKKHFEKSGHTVHKTEWIGAVNHEKEQQHQQPIGPEKPKKEKEQQHQQPIGPPGPGTQQHKEPIGPKAPGQEHQSPIGPEKPKEPGQQHNKPIGPVGPKKQKKAEEPQKSPDANVSDTRKDYKVHVWDKRRDKKGAGTRSVSKRPQTAIGKTADFLITGQTTAFDNDINKTSSGSSWLQNLKDKNAKKEEEKKASANTTTATNEVFNFQITRTASTWLQDLSESIKKSER